MRYQERIYIQNNNSGLRNRNNVNVNMSSDISVFKEPLFNVIGATKIDCTGTTSGGTYIITSESTIPLTFEFTGNTNTFSTTNASFKYEIYKYSDAINYFDKTASYKSESIQYSTLSGTNTTLQNIPLSDLSLDGEYLIKGYYDFTSSTAFLNKLGKNINTLLYKNGNEYALYDGRTDYYFLAIKQPDKPGFYINGSNNLPSNTFQQQTLLGREPLNELGPDGILLPPKPYRTFSIKCLPLSGVFTSNNNRQILQYDIYMSSNISAGTSNICSVGFPENISLNQIPLSSSVFLLATTFFNFMSIISTTSQSFNCIIEDYLN